MKNSLLVDAISKVKHRALLGWGIIAVAVIVIFYGLRCYTLMIDEAYMALCSKDYQNSPLAMMIFFIGNKWMNIFGDNFLSLRILCRISILISIAIGGIYLWKRTGNFLLTSIVCLFSALTVNLADSAIYNWDLGAYAVEAVGALFLLIYVQKPNLKYAILMGVIWGIMTAFRLPLIAYGGLIIIAIFGIHRRFTFLTVGQFIASIIGMLLAWFVCVIIMVGSIEAYIYSFRSENIITGHGVNVLEPYINQFMWYFPRQVFFGTPALIAMLVAMIYSFKGRFSLKSLLIVELGLLIVAFAFMLSYLQFSSMLLSGIGLPVFLLLVAWPVIAKQTGIESVDNSKFTYQLKLQLWLLVGMMFLMGFGSDTAFQRWSILFLFPLTIGILWPAVDTQSKRVIKYSLSVLVPFLLILVPIKYKLVSENAGLFTGDSSSVLSGVIIPATEQKRYVEIKEIADTLNARKLSFTFAGLKSRYIYSGEYEKNGYITAPLHYYHWEDGNEYMIDRFANKSDAVIYLGEYPKDFEYLKSNYGYNIIAKKNHCTVLAKKSNEINNPTTN